MEADRTIVLVWRIWWTPTLMVWVCYLLTLMWVIILVDSFFIRFVFPLSPYRQLSVPVLWLLNFTLILVLKFIWPFWASLLNPVAVFSVFLPTIFGITLAIIVLRFLWVPFNFLLTTWIDLPEGLLLPILKGLCFSWPWVPWISKSHQQAAVDWIASFLWTQSPSQSFKRVFIDSFRFPPSCHQPNSRLILWIPLLWRDLHCEWWCTRICFLPHCRKRCTCCRQSRGYWPSRWGCWGTGPWSHTSISG